MLLQLNKERQAENAETPETSLMQTIRNQLKGNFEPLPSTPEEIKAWMDEWEAEWGPQEFWSF